MKTREQIQEEVLNLKSNHIVLSLATGVGKSKLALEVTYNKGPLLPKVLVVYPRVNLRQNWIDEYTKWGFEKHLPDTTFTTYNSFHKHLDTHWDMVIFDEGHHLTDRVLELMCALKAARVLILSATLKPVLIQQLRVMYPDLHTYRMRMQEAVGNILAEPTIYLWPLSFKTVGLTETIVKNPKGKTTMKVAFNQRHMCKNRNIRYEIPCTEAQYYLDVDNMVDWYKRKAMGGDQIMKNLWLHKAGERLKWLAIKKSEYVLTLLGALKSERTLTFCASIDHTEMLGKNCIHSKNKASQLTLNKFNEGAINHITACSMLDEGVNLAKCRIGIFANLNSSEKLQIQRTGRILRHEKPIIIIPYFKNSREEEIVNQMMIGYNPELIHVVNSVEEIKL